MSDTNSLTESERDFSVSASEHSDDTSISHLRDSMKLLQKDNLQLRQEIKKLKKQMSQQTYKKSVVGETSGDGGSGSGGDDIRTTNDESEATMKSNRRSDPITSNSDIIRQTQEEGMSMLKARSEQGASSPSDSQPFTGNEVLESLVEQQQVVIRQLQKRITALEENHPLTERTLVCEQKIDRITSKDKFFENEIGKVISHNEKEKIFKERTFQAYIMNSAPIKATMTPLNDCKEIFWSSIHFSRETCVYTVPETGLYEFYARWRQSDTGKIRINIHWGADKLSRLGLTGPNDHVLCPTIRRFVEKDTQVHISAEVFKGSPKLETCDFGGSFISSRAGV